MNLWHELSDARDRVSVRYRWVVAMEIDPFEYIGKNRKAIAPLENVGGAGSEVA